MSSLKNADLKHLASAKAMKAAKRQGLKKSAGEAVGASALLVGSPYAELLVTGAKTLELRKTSCPLKHMNKQTFIVETKTWRVLGEVHFESVKKLKVCDLKNYEGEHRAPEEFLETYFKDHEEAYAYEVTKVMQYKPPVQASRQGGPIVWVNLPADVLQSIESVKCDMTKRNFF